MNWWGRPLTSIRTIVELIAATTTESGLTIRAGHDPAEYCEGVKISDAKLAAAPPHPARLARRLELHHPPGMKRRIKSAARPKRAPNGLRFGMFTACVLYTNATLIDVEPGYSFPSGGDPPGVLGGCNNCFRCAPAKHRTQVVKGLDPGEYLISNYDIAQLKHRNHSKSFTTMCVGDGDVAFAIEGPGRGLDWPGEMKLLDDHFSASDKRSRYIDKPEGRDDGEAQTFRRRHFSRLFLRGIGHRLKRGRSRLMRSESRSGFSVG